MAIISDDAGQFDVLQHGLCWVQMERLIQKLIPLNERYRLDIAEVREAIWKLYRDLKAYRRDPTEPQRIELSERFDAIFTQRASYATLNRLLAWIHQNKAEFLLVLERSEVPLHTNGGEQDIMNCEISGLVFCPG